MAEIDRITLPNEEICLLRDSSKVKVEANPTTTATDYLEKVKIDDDVYEIKLPYLEIRDGMLCVRYEKE